MVWEITFTTLGELPWVLLFSLRTCVYCVMGATPMVIGWGVDNKDALSMLKLNINNINFIS